MPANSLKSIFLAALDVPPEARDAWVEQACGDDQALLADVRELLEHQGRADSFLESPAAATDLQTVPQDMERQLGRQIGHYKLRELIGEGGMGMVYVAEQEKPIRRKVALKLIKPGMDSKAVLARFEAERNALALMSHPNIARVHDAGTTEEGAPYFVMELVNGVPITQYCDEQKLTVEERLQLFTDVCGAIQHAHQKGIIHRDIKPSNVLITELDGKPIAKVIDFGVAKALNQSLSDHSIYTAFQTVIGTPLYMSPEQASFSAVDVDTRSDVYSLGVLLYELLTGTTPVNQAALREAAQDEVFRLIREQDPPRPSNRISSLGDTSTRISQLRRTQPDQLGRMVKGDLDWIVMKALSKERGRRYDSANRLAEDVGRFMRNEVIEARPPSVCYQLTKLYQRHRSLVATVVAFVIAFFIAFGGVLYGLVSQRALVERQERTLSQLRDVLTDHAWDAAFSGDKPLAFEVIDQASTAGAAPELMATLRGIAMLMSGDSGQALQHLEQVVEQNPNSVEALSCLTWAYLHEAEYGKHEHYQEKFNTAFGDRNPATDYERLCVSLSDYVDGDAAKLRETMKLVSSLIAKKPYWGMAYIIRAKVRNELAMESKDLASFDQAVGDFEVAYSILAGSDFAAVEGLYLFIQALTIAGESRPQWITRAAELAGQLEAKQQLNTRGLSCLATYEYLFGDPEKGEAHELSVKQRGHVGPWKNADKTFGYGPKVRSVLPLPAGLDKDEYSRALHWACREPISSRQGISHIVDGMMRADSSISTNALFLDIALVLGDRSMTQAICEDALSASSFSDDYRWWQRYIRFHAGMITEQEFLTQSEPFDRTACFSYYGIAMKALSIGDIDRAREYFHKTVGTRTVSYWCYHNAQKFLGLLKDGWRPASVGAR